METLGAALEREHREIDAGIEAFTSGLAEGKADPAPLAGAIAALRRHIYLEEEFLFPPLRPQMMAPVFVMLREHGEMWATLDALDAQLAAGGADASMANACHELVAELERHNGKEEQIIYTVADELLSAEASAALQAFIDSGQMPEGWVCAKAS